MTQKLTDFKVSIILPTVNAANYLIKTLDSIKRNTENYELIIIENGSSDEVKQIAESVDFCDLKVIRNADNRCAAYALGQGIKAAENFNILFANDDIVCTPNWLTNLINAFLQFKDCGASGPMTCTGQEPQMDPKLLDKRYDMTIDEINEYAGQLKPGIIKAPIYGFCFLTTRHVFETVGVWDWKRYQPAFLEDTDWLWRLKQYGFNTYLVKDSYVHHYCTATFKALGADYEAMVMKNNKVFEDRKKDSELFVKNDAEFKYLIRRKYGIS